MNIPDFNNPIYYIITALLSLWGGRKLKFFEEKTLDAKADEIRRENYLGFVQDSKDHYNELKATILEIREDFADVSKDLEHSRKETLSFHLKLKEAEKTIVALEFSVEIWKKKYDDLCDKYEELLKKK